MKKIDPNVAASVAEAIRSIEAGSCAELVVEVRARSGSYAHADARTGAIVAFVALLFVLFSPWTFAPLWVVLDVAVAWVGGMFLSRTSNTVRRLVTTEKDRNTRVRRYAAATFVERGVANTERETGMLVYLSLLERRIEIIADRGVLDAVPVLEWNQLVNGTRTRRATQQTLVELLAALQPLLVRYAPARSGDRDELSNELRYVVE